MHLRNSHHDLRPTPFRPLSLRVAYRQMTCGYAAVDEAAAAVLWLPAPTSGDLLHTLSADLSRPLARHGIASCLFTEPDWRYPMYVLDAVRVALDHLRSDGITTVALVGHALGATVSLWGALDEPLVHTVVSLSATCLGPGPAGSLGPECSLLLVHGDADRVTSPDNSRYLYAIAAEPRQLILLRGADHRFTDDVDELRLLVRGWLVGELADRRAATLSRSAPARSGVT